MSSQVPNPPPYSHRKHENINQDDIVGHWEERLTLLQKLLLVKHFKEEKVSDVKCLKSPLSAW